MPEQLIYIFFCNMCVRVCALVLACARPYMCPNVWIFRMFYCITKSLENENGTVGWGPRRAIILHFANSPSFYWDGLFSIVLFLFHFILRANYWIGLAYRLSQILFSTNWIHETLNHNAIVWKNTWRVILKKILLCTFKHIHRLPLWRSLQCRWVWPKEDIWLFLLWNASIIPDQFYISIEINAGNFGRHFSAPYIENDWKMITGKLS